MIPVRSQWGRYNLPRLWGSFWSQRWLFRSWLSRDFLFRKGPIFCGKKKKLLFPRDVSDFGWKKNNYLTYFNLSLVLKNLGLSHWVSLFPMVKTWVFPWILPKITPPKRLVTVSVIDVMEVVEVTLLLEVMLLLLGRDTVDGRNPAPPGMVESLWIMG